MKKLDSIILEFAKCNLMNYVFTDYNKHIITEADTSGATFLETALIECFNFLSGKYIDNADDNSYISPKNITLDNIKNKYHADNENELFVNGLTLDIIKHISSNSGADYINKVFNNDFNKIYYINNIGKDVYISKNTALKLIKNDINNGFTIFTHDNSLLGGVENEEKFIKSMVNRYHNNVTEDYIKALFNAIKESDLDIQHEESIKVPNAKNVSNLYNNILSNNNVSKIDKTSKTDVKWGKYHFSVKQGDAQIISSKYNEMKALFGFAVSKLNIEKSSLFNKLSNVSVNLEKIDDINKDFSKDTQNIIKNKSGKVIKHIDDFVTKILKNKSLLVQIKKELSVENSNIETIVKNIMKNIVNNSILDDYENSKQILSEIENYLTNVLNYLSKEIFKEMKDIAANINDDIQLKNILYYDALTGAGKFSGEVNPSDIQNIPQIATHLLVYSNKKSKIYIYDISSFELCSKYLTEHADAYPNPVVNWKSSDSTAYLAFRIPYKLNEALFNEDFKDIINSIKNILSNFGSWIANNINKFKKFAMNKLKLSNEDKIKNVLETPNWDNMV